MTGGGGSFGSFFGGSSSYTAKNAGSFFNHVFDTSEPAKAELLNICQYALLALVPVVFMNKFLARVVPEADPDASSIELVAEIAMQIVVVFVGMVIIHRLITYIPTWSKFRYEPYILTHSILAFLVIVLSLNTKLGLKCSILYERFLDAIGWGAADREMGGGAGGANRRGINGRVTGLIGAQHSPSQADYLSAANPTAPAGIPPMAVSTTQPKAQGLESLLPSVSSSGGNGGGGNGAAMFNPMPIQAANSLLGTAFK
jgi:hypothetical protein